MTPVTLGCCVGSKEMERKWKENGKKMEKKMSKYIIYTLGFIFSVSVLVSVIMLGLHNWATLG